MTDPTFERIQSEITEHPVMLYMKGNAMFPQCDGIKQFSNWPTIPQLYVKGEFVGGCDIVTEMYQSGELSTLLTEKGVAHEAVA